MSNPYSFLPEVRQAIRMADDAERAAERMGELLAHALSALAVHDLAKAQELRGKAIAVTRGIMPSVARKLGQISLSRPK
ncbi:hypothetical protein [Sulfobacillus harzensis]|uniref:Uncharacterized protein n=1 Tax=Sulfobacillus harzensis TaxID=2729629 RepID=A0A7Y0L6J2_9FIRM|nr:hypothetical protein [Sulfobacillus harzensis]NMP24248.1 hypothetical protein [Sulfobacillus harzensis]